MGCGYENGFVFFTKNGMRFKLPEEYNIFYPPSQFISTFFPTLTATYDGIKLQINMKTLYDFKIPYLLSSQTKNDVVISAGEKLKKHVNDFLEDMNKLQNEKQVQIESMTQEIARLKSQLKHVEKNLENPNLTKENLIITKEELAKFTIEQIKAIKVSRSSVIHINF